MCEKILSVCEVAAQKKEWKPLRDSVIVTSG